MLTRPSSALRPLAANDVLSLGERAYRRLRDGIVEGTLASGTRISERSLALSLGISAQPVREALRRLEAEGMVVTAPRRGSVVADFGPERLREMSLIRVALEGVAAALAATHATPEGVEELRRQLRAMRPLTLAGNIDALADANERFHALINGMSGNAFLLRSLEALRAYDHFGRLRALRSSPQEPGVALREHAAIVAAIRRHDPQLAEARMRAHVGRSLAAGGITEATNNRGKPLE